MAKVARILIWLAVVMLMGCAAQRRPSGGYVHAPRPLSVPRVHR